MRKSLFCCFLVFCAVSILPAQEPAKPKDNGMAIKKTQSVDRYSIWKLTPEDAAGEESETVCAYMRTYRVRREYRGSDVVVPSGYTTCVPTRNAGLKSVLQVDSVAEK